MRKGFSLLEVIITIAVVRLLMSLLIVSVQAVRRAAFRMQNKNNLRQRNDYVDTPAGTLQHQIRDVESSPHPKRYLAGRVFKGVPKDLIEQT